jgi:hypothetical protein
VPRDHGARRSAPRRRRAPRLSSSAAGGADRTRARDAAPGGNHPASAARRSTSTVRLGSAWRTTSASGAPVRSAAQRSTSSSSGTHPHVVAEDPRDGPQLVGADLGVVGHLDDEPADPPPGEDDLDTLADHHLEVVRDEVVEGPVEVEAVRPRRRPARRAATLPVGAQAPTAARSASARSVRSQVNRSPSRPKCPYAAVCWYPGAQVEDVDDRGRTQVEHLADRRQDRVGVGVPVPKVSRLRLTGWRRRWRRRPAARPCGPGRRRRCSWPPSGSRRPPNGRPSRGPCRRRRRRRGGPSRRRCRR